MTFYDLSEFSMAKVKQFFSQQYQNIFSNIIKHKMCACVLFLLKFKPAFASSVIFQFLKHLDIIP